MVGVANASEFGITMRARCCVHHQERWKSIERWWCVVGVFVRVTRRRWTRIDLVNPDLPADDAHINQTRCIYLIASDGMCARCVCRCPISNSYYHKLSAKRVTYLARGAPNVDWLSDGRCCIRAGSFQCAPRDRHFIEYIAYICMYVHPNKDGDQCPSYICEINARNLDLINFQLSARFNSISAHFIYKFLWKIKTNFGARLTFSIWSCLSI